MSGLVEHGPSTEPSDFIVENLRTLYFDNAVNFTAGLPFIRTSPDHGTAYDIAGQNKANPKAMESALKLAVQLAQNLSQNR